MNFSPERPTLLWVDLHVGSKAAAGNQHVELQLKFSSDIEAKILPALSIPIQIYDFALPEKPSLAVEGEADWSTFQQEYPSEFEGITPRLLNRNRVRDSRAVRRLDQIEQLASDNRISAVISRLSPTVKWPPGKPPAIDWSDFDSLVEPWMQHGGFWPLPAPDWFDNFDPSSREKYWKQAADHFAQKNWLDRSAVIFQNEGNASPNDAQRILLAEEARQTLAVDERLRAAIPIGDSQSAKVNPNLLTLDPGLIAPPIDLRGHHWIVADHQASEQAIVSLGWQAYLHHVDLIRIPPGSIEWFEPGSQDGPIPTLQLKWLRRAVQDFEYLKLADERHQTDFANQMATLALHPVQLQPDQPVDQTYELFTGADALAGRGSYRFTA